MAKPEPLQIPLSQLQIGLTVKLPLSWTNHPFLRNRVDIKSNAEIALIRSLGVPYVIVIKGAELISIEEELPLEEPAELEPIIDEPDVRQELRKSMRLSQKRFVTCINDSRSIFSKVVTDPEGAYRLSATLVEDLLTHVKETDNPSLALVGSGENDVSVTQHGVSVAVLAMMIGQALNLPAKDLRDIALGSLFHDIGKLKVPDVIRRKRGALSDSEANFLQKHPNFGYEMMNRSGLFPPEVLHIILHHHELLDGTGYPEGLKGNKIPMTTQIVSLANDFDTQLNQSHIASPQVALGYLFKNRVGKHAQPLIAVLVKILGIYPPGTLVRLTDNCVGKVMMTTKEVKQPHVWACAPDGSDATLRLLIEEDVNIDQVVKIEDLTEGAIKSLKASGAISFYFSAVSTSTLSDS